MRSTFQILSAMGDQFVLTKREWGRTPLDCPSRVKKMGQDRVKVIPAEQGTGRAMVFFHGFLTPPWELNVRLPLLLNGPHKMGYDLCFPVLSGHKLATREVNTTIPRDVERGFKVIKRLLEQRNIRTLVIGGESSGALTALLVANLLRASDYADRLRSMLLLSPLLSLNTIFDPRTGRFTYDDDPNATRGMIHMHRTTHSGELRRYSISRRYFDSVMDPSWRPPDLKPKLDNLKKCRMEVIAGTDDPVAPHEDLVFMQKNFTAWPWSFSWDHHVFYGDMIYYISQNIENWARRQLA